MKTDPALSFPEEAGSRPRRPRATAKPGRCALPPRMSLLGCPPEALQRLRAVTVALVGCGSVGGSIAVHLARLGVGGLLLIDPKSFKPESLATHDIDPVDVGRPKAVVTARRCRAIHPGARVRAVVGPIEGVDLTALAGVDLFVMSPDLLAAEIATAQRCLWLGRPLIHASVHGSTLTVHLRTFSNTQPTGGCPGCCYGPAEWELMARQVRFSCAGESTRAAGPDIADALLAMPATHSLSPLCAAAASLAALQAVRLLLPAGASVGDTLVEYCGFTHRTVTTPIVRSPRCRLDHTALRRGFVPGAAGRTSLARWCIAATGKAPDTQASFELPGFKWIERAACVGCNPPTCPDAAAEFIPLRRFVPASAPDAGRCPDCGSALVPVQFHTHRAPSHSLLGAAVDRPLSALGAGRAPGLILHQNDSSWLILRQPHRRKSSRPPAHLP